MRRRASMWDLNWVKHGGRLRRSAFLTATQTNCGHVLDREIKQDLPRMGPSSLRHLTQYTSHIVLASSLVQCAHADN